MLSACNKLPSFIKTMFLMLLAPSTTGCPSTIIVTPSLHASSTLAKITLPALVIFPFFKPENTNRLTSLFKVAHAISILSPSLQPSTSMT